jgi:hypothetical protein
MHNPFAGDAADSVRIHSPDSNSLGRNGKAKWSRRSRCACSMICQALFWCLNCCGRGGPCTPKRMRYWAVVGGIIFTLLSTILLSIEFYRSGTQPHILAWYSGGVFVLIAIPLAAYEIFMHLIWYTKPKLQRHIIRIIWMVPVYGVESWFALRYKNYALYMQAAREFYEAFAVLSFLQFLLNNLGSTDDEIAARIKRDASSIDHSFPFCFMKRWRMGREFLSKCKFGVLSYVVAKIFTATVTFFCVRDGTYGEGTFNPLKGYIWVAMVDNVSQLWALYCLVLFYRGLHRQLAPLNPFSKFVTVKAVVFFSYWQSIAISICVGMGYIKHTPFYDTDDVSRALQNWLICVEMFLAALAHRHAFSYQEYVDRGEESGVCQFVVALFDSTIPFDFVLELGTFPSLYRRAQYEEYDYSVVEKDDFCDIGVEEFNLDSDDDANAETKETEEG